MKSIHFLSVILVSFSIIFNSCSSDNNNEVFITDETIAKEMIKGEWTTVSIISRTNYREFDKLLNKSYANILKENNLRMYFDNLYVTSTTQPKTVRGNPTSIQEKYFFENNLIYIEDISMKETLSHTYKISDTTLIMEGEFTRQTLIKMLQLEAENLGVDYSEIINAIPFDFSGNIIYTFKR